MLVEHGVKLQKLLGGEGTLGHKGGPLHLRGGGSAPAAGPGGKGGPFGDGPLGQERLEQP